MHTATPKPALLRAEVRSRLGVELRVLRLQSRPQRLLALRAFLELRAELQLLSRFRRIILFGPRPNLGLRLLSTTTLCLYLHLRSTPINIPLVIAITNNHGVSLTSSTKLTSQ